jgi:hypothetical protein
MTIHSDQVKTPYELCSGRKPDLSRFHTFGCHVYVEPLRPLRPARYEIDAASLSASVTALEDAYTDADLFETVCQIREDELDDAGTYELVYHIRDKAAPEELALGSFSRRKLKQLPI